MATKRAGNRESRTGRGAAWAFLNYAGGKGVLDDSELLECALEFANEQGAAREDPRMVANRNQLRECLEQYRQDPGLLFKRLQTDMRDHLYDVKIVSEWWIGEDAGLRSVKRFDEAVMAKWPPLLAYLVTLLFDDAKGLGKSVCRCQLDSCGRYFLAKAPKTGRPRRAYHLEKCMLKAHALESTERVRRSRNRRARKAK